MYKARTAALPSPRETLSSPISIHSCPDRIRKCTAGESGETIPETRLFSQGNACMHVCLQASLSLSLSPNPLFSSSAEPCPLARHHTTTQSNKKKQMYISFSLFFPVFSPINATRHSSAGTKPYSSCTTSSKCLPYIALLDSQCLRREPIHLLRTCLFASYACNPSQSCLNPTSRLPFSSPLPSSPSLPPTHTSHPSSQPSPSQCSETSVIPELQTQTPFPLLTLHPTILPPTFNQTFATPKPHHPLLFPAA